MATVGTPAGAAENLPAGGSAGGGSCPNADAAHNPLIAARMVLRITPIMATSFPWWPFNSPSIEVTLRERTTGSDLQVLLERDCVLLVGKLDSDV